MGLYFWNAKDLPAALAVMMPGDVIGTASDGPRYHGVVGYQQAVRLGAGAGWPPSVLMSHVAIYVGQGDVIDAMPTAGVAQSKLGQLPADFVVMRYQWPDPSGASDLCYAAGQLIRMRYSISKQISNGIQAYLSQKLPSWLANGISGTQAIDSVVCSTYVAMSFKKAFGAQAPFKKPLFLFHTPSEILTADGFVSIGP